MSPTNTLLRAVSRRAAAERRDGDAPRPAGATLRLPPEHEARWEAGSTHRLRLVVDGLDPARFERALTAVAGTYEALRLRVDTADGRYRLVEHPTPVARCDRADLGTGSAPVQYALTPLDLTPLDPSSKRVEVEIAIGAHLVDPQSWSRIVATLAEQYADPGQPRPADAAGQRYGDHLHRSVRQHGSAVDEQVVSEPEVDEPLRRLYGRPFAVAADTQLDAHLDELVLPVSAGTLIGAVQRAAVDALVDCGWAGPVTLCTWGSTRPEVLGATAEGHRATVDPVAGDLGPPSPTTSPVDLSIDLVDLPDVVLGATARLTPQSRTDVSDALISLCLVRTSDATRIVLAGPSGLLPAVGAELDRRLTGAPAPTSVPVAAPATTVTPDLTAPLDLPAPALRTATRRLAAPVVGAAVDRRVEEFRQAGVATGIPVVLELPPGPELVANLLAAARCAAAVLVLDPEDPRPWRDALRATVPGAVQVGPDNRVVTPATNPATETPGLLLGLGSAPAPVVTAVIGWPDLVDAARAFVATWRLDGADPLPLNVPVAGEDLVVRVLAAGLAGVELLVGRTEHETGELLGSAPLAALELREHERQRLPVAALAARLRSTRASTPTDADADVTRWWVAEAPAAALVQTSEAAGFALPAGSRIAAPDGHGVAVGAVGELRVAVGTATAYRGDPRRTADLLRPRTGGGRELRTSTSALCGPKTVRLVECDQQRVVHDGRTALLAAWSAALPAAALPEAVVGVQPPTAAEPERGYAVVTAAIESAESLELPEPLRHVRVVVTEPGRPGVPPSPAAARRSAADAAVRTARTTYAPPATDTERELADHVVEPLLRVAAGRDESFFALGATSLQLVRMSLRIRELTGIAVAPAEIFATPTLAAVAAAVDAAGGPDDEAGQLDAVLGVIDTLEGNVD